MPPPNATDSLNWSGLLKVAKFNLNISPKEFWKLTFREYWSMYEVIEPKKKIKAPTVQDIEELQRKWLSGNFRRVSSKPSR